MRWRSPSAPAVKRKRAATATIVGKSDAPQPVQAGGFQPASRSDGLHALTIGEASSVGNGGSGSGPQGGCGPDSARIEFPHQRTVVNKAAATRRGNLRRTSSIKTNLDVQPVFRPQARGVTTRRASPSQTKGAPKDSWRRLPNRS